MATEPVRVHCSDGPNRDEGGNFRVEERKAPSWVGPAMQHCGGCHDNFYNGRSNCTGNSWCWSLDKKYARRKTRPPCYH